MSCINFITRHRSSQGNPQPHLESVDHAQMTASSNVQSNIFSKNKGQFFLIGTAVITGCAAFVMFYKSADAYQANDPNFSQILIGSIALGGISFCALTSSALIATKKSNASIQDSTSRPNSIVASDEQAAAPPPYETHHLSQVYSETPDDSVQQTDDLAINLGIPLPPYSSTINLSLTSSQDNHSIYSIA